MTLTELRTLFEESGYDIAIAVLEDAKLPGTEEDLLLEVLEMWNTEKLHRLAHPSRYPAAYDPHTF